MRISYPMILSLTAAFTALTGCSDSDTAGSDRTSAEAETPMSIETRGAILYKRCRACHTLGEGERNRVGPNLWSVYGAAAGSKAGFNYSSAMSGSNIIWTDETLSAYLENPSKYIPGNRMSFAGLRNPEDREAILYHLKMQTSPRVVTDEAAAADSP